MRIKGIFTIVTVLLILVLVLSACKTTSTTQSQTSTTATQPAQTVKPPATGAVSTTSTTGHWWDELGVPTYGGTLTVAVSDLSAISLDTTVPMGGQFQYWLETLFGPSWTTDRKVWSFKIDFTPPEYLQPWLAESWEQTGPLTFRINLRKGVKWQNKPPVNGREFTAQDVEFNYDRMLGTGSGFTTPNAFFAGMMPNIEKVSAVDKYTVEFKMKQVTYWTLFEILGGIPFIPPEQVKTPMVTTTMAGGGGPPGGGPPPGGGGGPPGGGGGGIVIPEGLKDWHNAIGTGAWMLTDWVQGSSLTCVKNPDYWCYDERYPNNRLPYIDTTKDVAIPDTTSMLAALRTAKIDMLDFSAGVTWQQMEALFKTNPEFPRWPALGGRNGTGLTFVCSNKPFDDIRVRIAMQIAVDIKALANSIGGKNAKEYPQGLISPDFKGFSVPFADWPQDLKDEYTYNPAKAKQLLAEAGYPNGFKTTMVAPSGNDETIAALKSFFQEIGVQVDVTVMDRPSFQTFVKAGKADQLVFGFGFGGPTPLTMVSALYSTSFENASKNNDPQYDALVEKVRQAKTQEEAQKACIEADMYALRHHWQLQTYTGGGVDITWWPWVKGYMAEDVQGQKYQFYKTRWWIDQDLKKKMGH